MLAIALAGLIGESAFGCSVAMCLGGGVEFRQGATIQVIHEKQRMAGVSVTVSKSGQSETAVFSGKTNSLGEIALTHLEPGEYWISVELLGVSAGYHCFHVAKHSSWKAKRKVKYQWGDWASPVGRVQGELLDPQQGENSSPLWNALNPEMVPIAGAEVTLREPFTGHVWRTVSANDGTFSIEAEPEHLYVLQFAGGLTGRAYEPTVHLIRLTQGASEKRIRMAWDYSCGPPRLTPIRTRH